MIKKFLCSECNAVNVYDEANVKDKCNYCGSIIDLSNEATQFEGVSQASLDASSFKKSLDAEINGQKASIVDMWESLVSNRAMSEDKMVTFCKNLKVRIRFCIEAYQSLSNEAKYELGDFICTQMESLIKFRIKHKLVYLDDLDDIDALISKQEYERKARGVFQFKAKFIIKKRIKRIKARRAVLLYDYVTQATKEITEQYSSKIEPLQSEFNATAMTAFGRRKELKEKINSYELAKKRALDSLGAKAIIKAYNKTVKKFKIKHENDMIKKLNDYVPKQIPVTKKVVDESTKINYTVMSTAELIDELLMSLNNLKKSVTRSELEKMKEINAALVGKSGEMKAENQPYLNAVTMSVNMIFSNEHPAVIDTMINNLSGNIIAQANTLKSKLN